MVKPFTFTCAFCGWRGDSDRSQEEADAEYAELFNHPGERVVVCDDCFRWMVERIPPRRWDPQ